MLTPLHLSCWGQNANFHARCQCRINTAKWLMVTLHDVVVNFRLQGIAKPEITCEPQWHDFNKCSKPHPLSVGHAKQKVLLKLSWSCLYDFVLLSLILFCFVLLCLVEGGSVWEDIKYDLRKCQRETLFCHGCWAFQGFRQFSLCVFSLLQTSKKHNLKY